MRYVLLVLFLLTWLTGCGNTRTEYVAAPVVPIPTELLIDCIVPEIPHQMTYGDSVELNERLLTVIEKCNADKQAIREIEAAR
ncbi:Rz1-like lysis system protein LysC [Pectobacterium odoriferum]|uniref:Rz1-like lysis system protein LysC n=1 Tax=Pectobacterium odoriferum TaxID=78398 RepID=UPI003D9A4039